MKYRRQSGGGLEEAMKTVVEVFTLQELKKEIENYWHEEIEWIEFRFSVQDDRIGWKTYLVLCKFKPSLTHKGKKPIVTGFSDGVLEH